MSSVLSKKGRHFGVARQVLAHFRNGEHDLLHRPVVADNLDLGRVVGVVVELVLAAPVSNGFIGAARSLLCWASSWWHTNVAADLFGSGRLYFRAVVLVTDEVIGAAGHVHQLARVAEDPLLILALPATPHRGQQQSGRIVLELQDQIHSPLAQRINVRQHKGRDNVQPVGFVFSDAVLVLVTGNTQVR